MGSLTFSGQSGKVCYTHSVDPIGDLDLGILAVAYIAPDYANAVPPTHRIPGTPNPTHLQLRRDPAPTAALAGFARRAPGQSRSPDMSLLFGGAVVGLCPSV